MTGRPDRDGDHQFSLLEAAWQRAAQYWLDDMARDFDSKHLTPLRQESRHYLDALGRLLDLLDAAERDTEF